MLLFFTLGAFYAQRFWLGKKSYTTVSGKGDAGVHPTLPRAPALGRSIGVAGFWAVFTIVVYATIFYGSFVKLWGVDFSLTFSHYVKAFAVGWNEFGIHWRGSAWSSFWTTITIALVSAPLTAMIGLLTAYLLVRQDFAGKNAFEFGTMLSFAIPGTVIGVSYVIAFNVPPIELTGTGVILVLSFIFRNMPVGVRAGVASMSQIDRSLDESSLTLGANSWQTFRQIVLPLLRPGDPGGAGLFLRARHDGDQRRHLPGQRALRHVDQLHRRPRREQRIRLAIAYSAVLIAVMLAGDRADAACRRQPQHRPRGSQDEHGARRLADQCQPARHRRSSRHSQEAARHGGNSQQRRLGGVPRTSPRSMAAARRPPSTTSRLSSRPAGW